MTQDTKQRAGSAAGRPQAELNPQGHSLPVAQDDAPKGNPTSDRFQTEQAHQDAKEGAEEP